MRKHADRKSKYRKIIATDTNYFIISNVILGVKNVTNSALIISNSVNNCHLNILYFRDFKAPLISELEIYFGELTIRYCNKESQIPAYIATRNHA